MTEERFFQGNFHTANATLKEKMKNIVAFIFDDVLDFGIAKNAGIRIMIARNSTPALTHYAVRNKLTDYVTAHDGGHHGFREAIELLMYLGGNYDEAIDNRVAYSETYKQ